MLDGDAVERLDMDAATEADVRATYTGARPGLDLREAGLAVSGRTLRLQVRTDGPIRGGTFVLTAYTPTRCGDAQLSAWVRLSDDGEATVEASDLPSGVVRPVDAAKVEVDGDRLTVSLPLLVTARRFEDWTVTSSGGGFADSLPDVEVSGAGYTRDYGTPNYAGGQREPCGPADPPLLPR